MFPGPNASVYYNEAGEPMGWDNDYYDDAPEPYEYEDRPDGQEEAFEAGYEDGYQGVPSQVTGEGDGLDRAYLVGYDEGRSDRDADDEASAGIGDEERFGD